MSNPIIERELVGLLRTKKALWMLVATAAVFALLVILRWPTDGLVAKSGAQARQVFQLFGYGMLAVLLLMVPVFPATSIVHERIKGTMALLLNSPMSALSIYIGKLTGVLGFVLLLLIMSVPAAAACYVMGGLSITQDVLMLYGVLALASLQFCTLALWVSTYAGSNDSALRITYGCVLLLVVVVLGPNLFFQGSQEVSWSDLGATFAEFFRAITSGNVSLIAAGFGESLMSTVKCIGPKTRSLSPIPALMEILGHGDVGGHGMVSAGGEPRNYAIYAGISIAVFFVMTLRRLNYSMFDRSRSQGIITDDQNLKTRAARRVFFLIDPQRRKAGISFFMNPVMVKEFRCRAFGRLNWLLRIIGACALVSLGLTYMTTMGTQDWGVETIGGMIVVLQVALIVMFTPSLAAGLISSERESGGWDLLRMTPMSAFKILRGKLMSVVWTVLLVLCATLPGYLVMMWIKPVMETQVHQVIICLLYTTLFAVMVSATMSSLFFRTGTSTAVSYGILMVVCAGTLLIWLGRGAPFGHSTVEAALAINPMAAALNVIRSPGFTQYNLVPLNWWIMGVTSGVLFLVLVARTWRLTRPT